MHDAQPAPRRLAALLFDPRGTIGRETFAAAAFALAALKVCIDYIVAERVLGADWTWQNYLFSNPARPITGAGSSSASELAVMLSIAAPFAWAGIALSAKRLRSAGVPVALVIFFFVPIVKYFLFAILCTFRSVTNQAEPAAADSGAGWFRRNEFASAVLAVVISAAIGAVAIAVALESPSVRDYGGWMFLGLPFLMGFVAAFMNGLAGPRRLGQSFRVALWSLALCGAGLLVFAFEGLICILMAAPLAACEAIIGAWIAHTLQQSPGRRTDRSSIGAALVTLPLLMLLERGDTDRGPINSTTSEVIIEAPREIVWRHVIAFGELPPPRELIFRAGIAYPKHATITGRGVGAVRHCVFSTGAFVEPITVWDEPARLAFDVSEQPDPMRELSPYRDLQTPHLEGYFRSVRGEFRLVADGENRTLLQGTTWYENRIEPQFYWRYWSEWLIHRIHVRVLEHIKRETESAAAQPL